MLPIVISLVVLLVVVPVAIVIGGRLRWRAITRTLRLHLNAARDTPSVRIVDFRELDGLPAPVQRFFRAALTDRQPVVSGVHLRHRGTFNMGESTDRWRPFRSRQQVVTRRPGFDWDARIRMMPGLNVHVHDAYVNGAGILHAAVLGLFPVIRLHDRGTVAEGELLRFFAEAAWYPTALLPSQGVHWEPLDEHSARATASDGAHQLTMTFTFNEAGLIDSVRMQTRARSIGKHTVPTPWQGRFWDYQQRDGMQVPLEGEVAWLLPEGARPYWRGRVTALTYTFVDRA